MKRKIAYINIVLFLTIVMNVILSSDFQAFHSGAKPANYSFEEYLKTINIPLTKYFAKEKDVRTAGTYRVNKQIFEQYHIVVYGDGSNTRQYGMNSSVNGLKQGHYRFYGLSPDGVAVKNPNYPDDTGSRGSSYLTNSNFVKNPWNEQKLLNKAEVSAHKSYFPSPRQYRVTSYDRAILGGAYETYNNENAPGNFLKGNKYHGYTWLASAPTAQYYNYTNNYLHDYAHVVLTPSAYTSGVFNLFTYNTGCQLNYCYSSFLMAPYNNTNDWIDFQCHPTNLKVEPQPSVANASISKMTTSIELYGSNPRRYYPATVSYYFEGFNKKWTQQISLKTGQKSVTLDLSTGKNVATGQTERLTFPAVSDGKAKLVVEVKSDDMDHIETRWNKKASNICNHSITVTTDNNASVTLNPSSTKIKAGAKFGGTFTVQNNFKTDIIDAPPSSAAGHALLHSSTSEIVKNNGNKAVLRLYKGNNLLETTTYEYKNIAAKKKQAITIDSKYKFTQPGEDYKATVCIPVYMDSTTKKPETPDDNCHTIPFIIDSTGDVSIGVNGKEVYQAESDINLRYELSNMYPKVHANVPITFTVTDLDTGKKAVLKDGSTTMTFTADNVEIGDIVYDNVPKFQLPMGRYKADISIPNYPAESDYDNNKDSFEFTVLPFTPDNVECKVLDLEHVKVIEGEHGVSKFCIGQTPNYPSTTTEQGQGTFFFVLYRLLPMPIPSYNVTNLDDKGLYQLYSLNEPKTERGDDDSYIFFPTDKNNKKNLAGPYTAGPHEFYHYMYRGRMMPTEVTFDIKVSDPNGKLVPEASGQVFYKVDKDKCYNKTQLDVGGNKAIDKSDFSSMDPCRQVYFYLPKERTDKMTVDDMKNTPRTEDRLHFKNPGVHTFDIKANEKQIYMYQKDNGAEWQGNETANGNKYLRSAWKNENINNAKGYVNTNTVVNGEWKIQDTYNNHCYSDNDAFDRVGKWIGTNFSENNNVRNECYHNHGSDWHFWRFNWSNPIEYGDMD